MGGCATERNAGSRKRTSAIRDLDHRTTTHLDGRGPAWSVPESWRVRARHSAASCANRRPVMPAGQERALIYDLDRAVSGRLGACGQGSRSRYFLRHGIAWMTGPAARPRPCRHRLRAGPGGPPRRPLPEPALGHRARGVDPPRARRRQHRDGAPATSTTGPPATPPPRTRQPSRSARSARCASSASTPRGLRLRRTASRTRDRSDGSAAASPAG